MRVAGPDRGEIPNFAVEVNSTIDISSGLGGCGAEAAAIALCFLSATGQLMSKTPLSVGSKEFDKVFEIAYRVEEFIHGKTPVNPRAGPYSSGASVFGALVGNPGKEIYRYQIVNSADVAKSSVPSYTHQSISMKIDTKNLLLIQGKPKETKDCLVHIFNLLERLAARAISRTH